MKMQKIKSEINYKVPSWNFCNIDSATLLTGKVSKDTCRFCIKKNGAFRCVLHDEPLNYDGTFIEKTEGCKVASVGVAIEILEPEPPRIDPKQIIKLSIEGYETQLKTLVSQGYPRDLAAKLSKQYMLGD